MAASQAGTPLATDCIDFVNKDNGWRLSLGGRKQVAHSAGTDADKHLDEFASVDTEVRSFRLTCDGACQERLAGARWADQQHSLGYASTQLLKTSWIFQKLDDFLQVCFHAFQSSNILKGDRLSRGFIPFCWTAGEIGKEAASTHHRILTAT